MALKEFKSIRQCCNEKCKKAFVILMQAQWGSAREADKKDVIFCPFCGGQELKDWVASGA